MADLALTARSPLADQGGPGPSTTAGVVIAERATGRIFTVLARKDQMAAIIERARGFGVTLPAGPRRATGKGHSAVWTAPGQWLVEVEGQDGHDGRDDAGPLLRGFAGAAALCSTVATEDARVVLSVGGERARDALAKILTIDLHPRVFKPGDAAVTVAGGMAVIVWLREDAPVFECAVPRSVARSFHDWLTDSAAEYGSAG